MPSSEVPHCDNVQSIIRTSVPESLQLLTSSCLGFLRKLRLCYLQIVSIVVCCSCHWSSSVKTDCNVSFLPHVFFLSCVRMSPSLSKIVRLKRCILFWALCNEASYYSWLYCTMYIVSLMCCSLWDLASVQCWQLGLTKQWSELFQLNLLRNWYSHSLILPICGHSSREILKFHSMRIPPGWELLTYTVAIIF